MKKFITTTLVILCIVTSGALYLSLFAPNLFEGDRFVVVSRGENFSQVIDSLGKAGVIKNRLLIRIAGKMLNLTTRMQIGKYRFRSGMSNKEILEDLREGKTVEQISVSIPEGWRASRQAKYLARTIGLDSVRFMTLIADTHFIAGLGIQAASLEGYLFPETYKLYWQADEGDVVKEFVRQFRIFFNDSLQHAVAVHGMTVREILTVASIVEAETSVDSERSVVAGVYYNRLKRHMRLEADPTVEYILKEGPRQLFDTDLRRESAYNTYRNYGLPPGPINNPGRASILAALHPKKHKYLFFVATGQGGHTFSSTFAQHLEAVKRYRKIVKAKMQVTARQKAEKETDKK
jgi:UPF0755 protein